VRDFVVASLPVLVVLWTGKSMAHKANVTTSKSYNTKAISVSISRLLQNKECSVRDASL